MPITSNSHLNTAHSKLVSGLPSKTQQFSSLFYGAETQQDQFQDHMNVSIASRSPLAAHTGQFVYKPVFHATEKELCPSWWVMDSRVGWVSWDILE